MNRREALTAFMGLPAAAVVTRAEVKPNDILVIECPGSISPESADKIQAAMKNVFPDHKCVALGDGSKLRIVRP